jgi:hypothetical protein
MYQAVTGTIERNSCTDILHDGMLFILPAGREHQHHRNLRQQ